MYKTLHVRTTVWSWDVEKWGSQLASQLARKIVRRCGEKHIFKWKCTKHCMFGPLFEVEMLKNCTPLWREAHFQVKMYKTLHVRSTVWSWDVEKLHAALARSTFVSQWGSQLASQLARKIVHRCGEKHIFKWKCTKHCMFGPLFEVEMLKNCTPLWREAHL